jgi:hypothetical protein
MCLPFSIDPVFGTAFTFKYESLIADYGRRLDLDCATALAMPNAAQLRKWLTDDKAVELPAVMGDEPLTVVGRAAFASNTHLVSIVFPDTVRTIDRAAFFRCAKLKKVSLPADLKLIGRSAFNGCTSLTEITIPSGCIHISARAFYNCKNLRSIFVPATVGRIEEEAFAECPQLELVCPVGSYAAEYAAENGLRYRIAASSHQLSGLGR